MSLKALTKLIKGSSENIENFTNHFCKVLKIEADVSLSKFVTVITDFYNEFNIPVPSENEIHSIFNRKISGEGKITKADFKEILKNLIFTLYQIEVMNYIDELCKVLSPQEFFNIDQVKVIITSVKNTFFEKYTVEEENMLINDFENEEINQKKKKEEEIQSIIKKREAEIETKLKNRSDSKHQKEEKRNKKSQEKKNNYKNYHEKLKVETSKGQKSNLNITKRDEIHDDYETELVEMESRRKTKEAQLDKFLEEKSKQEIDQYKFWENQNRMINLNIKKEFIINKIKSIFKHYYGERVL